jgi:hypothetical protein
LPTILSRAMVIKFSALSDAEMREYVDENYQNIPAEEEKLLIKLSM